MSPRTLFFLVICFSPAVAGCLRHVDPAAGNCQSVVEAYLHGETQANTINRFASLELETQYRVYLCANQYMHPPILGLDRRFAAQGDRAATFLIDKLLATDHDATVGNIVMVFEEMSYMRSYDVRDDATLMQVLRWKTGRIHDPTMRALALNRLYRIRNGLLAPESPEDARRTLQ